MPDACIGNYPHIGADHYGFYVTTNEYPFFTDGFNSAQIYGAMAFTLVGLGNYPSAADIVFSDSGPSGRST